MAGLITTTLTVTSLEENGVVPLSSNYEINGNEKANFAQLVPIGSATHYAMEFAHAGVQCVDIISDQTMELNFNSNGSPVPALALTAGQIVHWDVEEFAVNPTFFPNPFTADVTGFYCTNSVAANLSINVVLQV